MKQIITHPEPLTAQESQASYNQAEFELKETVEEFEKDVIFHILHRPPPPAFLTFFVSPKGDWETGS